MIARVKNVKPNPNYTLILVFDNGERKVFDVKLYLDIGVFQELKDLKFFNAFRPFLGSVEWPHGQDFCPDTLYLDGKPTVNNN